MLLSSSSSSHDVAYYWWIGISSSWRTLSTLEIDGLNSERMTVRIYVNTKDGRNNQQFSSETRMIVMKRRNEDRGCSLYRLLLLWWFSAGLRMTHSDVTLILEDCLWLGIWSCSIPYFGKFMSPTHHIKRSFVDIYGNETRSRWHQQQ
jgi:hypothetical protein